MTRKERAEKREAERAAKLAARDQKKQDRLEAKSWGAMKSKAIQRGAWIED